MPDRDGDRLPASPGFLVPRAAGATAAAVAGSWVWLGEVAGLGAAAALLVLFVLFLPRALLLDGAGFRIVRIVPGRRFPWSQVERFFAHTSGNPRTPLLRWVRYEKAGRRARWWYPAGWPAEGSILPAFSAHAGGPALAADELCVLLNERLSEARARAA